MNDLTKLGITKDSFIYSVNQAYEARIRNDGNFNSHLRYEPFLEKTWALPQNLDLNSLKNTLAEIIEHHYTKLPNYRREEIVNIENISWFSHSIAALFADVEFLIVAYTGHGLPTLATPKIPRTNSSKNIVLAIKKYSDFKTAATNGEKFALFPIASEGEVAVDDAYTQEIWSLVFYYIKKYYGAYAELIDLYATWKYISKVSSSDMVDWNVRPPCGDLYRKQFKHLFEKDYFKNNARKNGKENFQKPDLVQAPNNDEKSTENQSKPQESFESKPHRTDKFPRESGRDKPPFRERKERPRNTEREPRQNQEEIIEKALIEVSLAIKKLNENSALHEIALAPQNSFIRRQQHELICEKGFETESQGEGDGRCVCIKRK
ncbi:MAG: R3H domain-containing nucleic acid-binding protein [Bdellovibrionota bacterium]